MNQRERLRLGGIIGFIALLHVVGWGTLVLIVVPQQLSVGSQAFGIGIGLTAYTLGMRHAFDADHIAAIDNTTRKLMTHGQRPLSVGFWFSLGHSTIVFGLAFLLALGIRGIAGSVTDEGSALHDVTGLIGSSVSGAFLYIIAFVNIAAFIAIAKIFRRMRSGQYDEQELELQLAKRGVLNRFIGKVMRPVSKPWHMYPVGLLFGLGFDTATEIALLVIAGAGAASGLPWYAILCLPVLFAAGMTLLDTLDGSFMNFAYGWAFSRPVRKIYYNLTITALSVLVAVVIGTVQVASLLAEKLGLHDGVWAWLGSIDLSAVGLILVGLFLVTWVVAASVWRFGRIEQRWVSRARVPGAEPR
ncbi:HoxN/HupN/NixA family nickel/cobalt transporter [Herbiconiux sp. CPCC 205763]|uniref:Nickel/cobalt efflux system n=1 Tax=Herbiconiux aconitum TaxID=2970913 RepID=A0ABT2GVT1_9MICO|nr:HoxN/HupN/NixA family nickel/cobalt transporter [Herbiconiux aconitum]MCS5720327.1 HoxN/HupN/NixA family nickel/cobalt transporter [Herbiconiux aconitum]